MNVSVWRLLITCSLFFITYLQVTACNQLILSNVTNSDNQWFGWSEQSSLPGAYWVVCNGTILLNTTCPSCSSGSRPMEQQPQYYLLSPSYMTLTGSCNVTITYTRQADIIVEVIVRLTDNNNVTIGNLSGAVEERQTLTLPVIVNQSIDHLVFNVTSDLNDELLSIDSVNLSDCSDSITPTPSAESSLVIVMESTTIDLSQASSTIMSTVGLTVSRMLSLSGSQFNAPVSSSVMIISSTSVLLTSVSVSTFATTIPAVATSSSMPTVLSTTTISSLINTVDIASVTSSTILQSTSLPMTLSTEPTVTSPPISTASNTALLSSIASSSMISSITLSSSVADNVITVQSSAASSISIESTSSSVDSSLITETLSPSLSSSIGDVTTNTSTVAVGISSSSEQPANTTAATMPSSPSVVASTSDTSLTATTVMPSSSNVSANSTGDTGFFTTTVIIGISAGGGTLLLVLLCLLVICCACRLRISRRSQQHKYFISNNTGYKNSHKGHSSVYAHERYRHKSRSVESMNGPYQYELPFVHVAETAPEAYVRNTNGDEDTIDSESEDIRRDLKGTPTSSCRGSQSGGDHEEPSTGSFYPQADMSDHHWSDYSSDNNDDETSSDIVYPNKSLLNEMCTGDLPPILSLGDYEDDDNVVIVNPYNPTIYSEADHIPNKDISPRRAATTKSNINLEALTTLESSGEYTPKQSVPNYRRRHHRYAAGKHHKSLRKTKSEVNLEDATRIAGARRHPRHQSKSRIDLKEATKLGQSDVARVNHHHRQPHHLSTPRMLDSSSRLERLTSLDTY